MFKTDIILFLKQERFGALADINLLFYSMGELSIE